MNNDVLIEILLHLPVQSLLRFRAVCKFWADVINSSYFQKLHTHSNRSDEVVCLDVILSNVGIRVQHNTKSLISCNTDHLKRLVLTSDRVSLYGPDLYGPVKGLTCINIGQYDHSSSQVREPIVIICNPFLGQFKVLPHLITTSSCRISPRSVAFGFDEDYKVVQLSFCYKHDRLHAYVYSIRTDSWRDLAFDYGPGFFSPIKSRCMIGHFAHWRVTRMGELVSEILSLDMKNEVFKKITFPADKFHHADSTIWAKDEHVFWLFDFSPSLELYKLVYIYESRCEGSELTWKYIMSVDLPDTRIGIIPQWRTGFVVIEIASYTFVYDYRANKLVYYKLIGDTSSTEYKGSFVSLGKEN